MATKKINPTNPTAAAKTTDNTKTADDRKTAAARVHPRKLGRLTKSFRGHGG